MVKYIIPYKSYDDASWLLSIDIPGYNGDPIMVRAVVDQACKLFYSSKDYFSLWDSTVITLKAEFSLYNQGQMDIEELLFLGERDCIVTLKRNDEIKFSGYLDVEDLVAVVTAPPYNVSLKATTGFEFLEGLEFRVFGAELGDRSPLNYFRRILMHQLGTSLPIRWSMSLEALNEPISGDPFQNLKWSQYGDGFMVNPTTENIRYQSCYYIIEGMTRALQCRIFQADGAWWVLGINEQFKEDLTYFECANTTGLPIVTEHSRNIRKSIGDRSDYRIMDGNNTFQARKAQGSVTVTYDHNQLENILPNGGLDQWSTGSLMWWGLDGPGVLLTQEDSITSRGGSSVKLVNLTDSRRLFGLRQPLPIDGHTLYRTFQWGFTFMAVSGFALNDRHEINWDDRPLKAMVKYSINENGSIVDYYLNEFGYWQKQGESLDNAVKFDRIEYSVDIPLNIRSIRVFFSGTPRMGDEMTIRMRRKNADSNSYADFTHVVNGGTDNNLDLALDSLKNALPSRLGSKSVTMIDATHGSVNYQDYIHNGVPTANVTNYANSETFKYIHFTKEELKYNDSVAFAYQGAGQLDNKIIDPGMIDKDTLDGVGLLSIDFVIEPGQSFHLDDIWMSLNFNKDVYKATYGDLNNTRNKEFELSISSSFSGFKTSNFMQAYYTSDDDWKFTDGANIGSLTELYARAVMRDLYRPRLVITSPISTRGKDWSFLDTYSVEGKTGMVFMPTYGTYNTERNEVDIVAVEHGNEDIAMTVKHYGSEEETGLNFQR